MPSTVSDYNAKEIDKLEERFNKLENQVIEDSAKIAARNTLITLLVSLTIPSIITLIPWLFS